MKYKWIELYGYAGIYNGMGLMQIKIDFTKCKTNKIIIRGSNGSGKSTLINAINPNPDSNDKFIPNSEARKNICLTDNGVDYIIRYIHPINNSGRGTTKGYISKTINGQLVELNPNGNISSCKDILYEEFNLDSNFISLSKLSSEDRGLVDNKPAERKKLINSIISVLDTYNGIYKTLSKKSNGYKQIINSLTSKIDYLGNEVQLTAKLQNIENRLNNLENEKNMTIEAMAAVRLKISEYINILKDNNYDSVVSELKDISSHNKILRNKIINKSLEFGIDKLDSLESFLNYINKQIIIYDTDINSLKNQVLVLLSQREVEFNELKDKKSRLESLQSEYNYIDIKNAVKSSQSIVDDYNKIFNKIGLMNINMITKTEFDCAMESLKYLKDLALNLTSCWSIEKISLVISNQATIKNKILEIPILRSNLEKLKNIKSELDTNIAIYLSKMEIINELNNRPSNCTIDDCPYIKNALETSIQYPSSNLISMQNEFNDLCKDIELLENNLNDYNEYSEIMSVILSINRELDSKMKFISKLPVRSDFRETFLQRVVNLDSFKDIDELYKYIDCGNMIEEYKIAKDQLLKYESEYKLYEAKNNIIESIIKDIEILNSKTDKLASQIDQFNNDIFNKQNKLDSLKSDKIKVEELVSKIKDDLIPSEEKESELIKIKQNLDTNSSEITKLQNELDCLNANLGSVNNDIKNLTADKDTIKHSLMLLSDYKLELKQYSEKYTKIEKIRYYSSPSTGIQTLFMQLYMNKIISVANDLLSLLFDGEFVLQPFIINENEFRIPCLGSGLIHDDISSMSTAQKCMISMILSFSILHQSSTKYNVIMLDELDGGLDTSNRILFIDLLDKLMYMLQCEQCFIISHNNELSTTLSDLIILKNNSGDIYDGNVIWQY